MANETDYLRCVDALGEVSEAFLRARSGLPAPTQYEADLASFKLMEVVLQHVNGASRIAVLPKPGSHLVSTWVLLRSAFEIALTAYWLALDDDWKEREARWLGWISGEEVYQRRLASDLRPVAGDGVRGIENYALRLEQRRLAITGPLPKDAREKRPEIPRMLQECGIDKRYYVAYRIGSQLTHGGPAVCEEVWETDGSVFRTKEVNYVSWVGPLQMAGWCVAQPGYAVLCRAGAKLNAADNLIDAHERLCASVSRLEV